VFGKGSVLLYLNRLDEAIKYLCRAWPRREHLPDGGALLAELFAYLDREPEEC
jgi:hypothetical protein